MTDNVLLAEKGIIVSQTRLVVDGDTYAMAHITFCKRRYSDEVETDDRKKSLRFLLIVGSIVGGVVLAIVLSLGGSVEVGTAVGVVLGIGGLIAALFIDTKLPYRLYSVSVGTNSGPMDIVVTRDLGFSEQVERAISDAFVARG